MKEYREKERVSPFLALAFIAGGTILALWTIPSDVEPKGALFLPALFQAMGLLAAPVIHAFRNWKAVFLGENMLCVGLVFWLLLDPLQGLYALTGLSPGDVTNVFLAIGLMGASVWLGTLARPWSLPNAVKRVAHERFNPSQAFYLALLLFGLGIFRYLSASGFNPLAMFSYLGVSRWAAPWKNSGQLGGWGSFIDHMVYFGYLLPSLTVVLGHYLGKWDGRVWVSTALSIILLLFFAQDGGRRIVGVVLGSSLVTWILLQYKLDFRVFAISFVSILSVLFIIQFMLKSRETGYSLEAATELIERGIDKVQVDDNFYRLGQSIKIFPEKHNFVYEKQVVYVAVRPIPRAIWSGKPTGPGYNFSKMVGVEGATLTRSVVAELYASLGYLAVFLGGYFYGRLASMWDRLLWASYSIPRKKVPYVPLLYSIGLFAMFLGLRSMIGLVLISYSILAWIVLSYTLS